jgi:hypothetical protein
MFTLFDFIVFGVAIVAFMLLLLMVSVKEGFLGIKTQTQLQIVLGCIVFIPIIIFYTYAYWVYEPLDNQVYERYYGKFERIVQITGSSKYPNVTVKTSAYTLYDMETRYFKNVSVGDKIYFRVVGDGRHIHTYYLVGGVRYGVSSCYYPMTCWDNMIEKYNFVTGEQNDISPYIRRP